MDDPINDITQLLMDAALELPREQGVLLAEAAVEITKLRTELAQAEVILRENPTGFRTIAQAIEEAASG